MTPMPRAAALVAIVLAACVALLTLLQDRSSAEPPTARSAQPGARVLVAAAPMLPALAEFDVNPLNPFVPWQLRDRRDAQPRVGDRPIDGDPAGHAPPRTGDLPAKRWPSAAALPSALAPVGVVVHERGARALVVRTPDGVRMLLPGSEILGWRLDDVDADTASFTAPDGRALALAIPRP